MSSERHPRGLYALFMTEMWERFSFYLMLGILPLYVADSQKGGLGWGDEWAAIVVGTYTALVYFTPFIGGLIADRVLGLRRTILIGGTLMMCGHLALAWPTAVGLYLGLGLLILGNGAFKPNVSTILGNLYPPGSPLKDAGYNIFYMGINVGAFTCNFVAAIVRNYFDRNPLQILPGWTVGGWHAAFGTAAIGMLIGLVVFGVNYRRLAPGDPPVQDRAGDAGADLTPLWIQCVLPAVVLGGLTYYLRQKHIRPEYVFGLGSLALAFLVACIPVAIFYLSIWRSLHNPVERGRVAGLLVVFLVSIVFWATFALNTTTLNVWARDDTDRRPNAVVQPVTDNFEDFAENAPPDYYFNASAADPRPARGTLEVVSDERYKQLEEEKKLDVVEGKKVYVTPKMVDKMYARATPQTPTLPEGKHLKLVNTELFQSIEPGYLVLFTPLIVAFWRFLRLRNREPSTPAKLGFGLVLVAMSPLIMWFATRVANDGEFKVSAWWLFATYLLVAWGELCLSPMGLSLVNKMAPSHLRAFMMGGWFVSTGIGYKLSGIFGETYQKVDHYAFWDVLVIANLAFAVLIFLLVPWLNRQMADEA